MTVVQRCYGLLISALLSAAVPATAWSQQHVFAYGNATNSPILFEDFETDSDNVFNQTNGRFSPTEAGTYYIHALVHLNCGGNSESKESLLQLRKNGTVFTATKISIYKQYSFGSRIPVGVAALVPLNGSGDYVDINNLGNCAVFAATGGVGNGYHSFTAFKLGGGGSGDNLGDHTATQDLNMSGHNIVDTGMYFHDSDRRLKTHIVPLSGLEILKDITGVSFNWKKDGRPATGMIAQEVEPVLPHAVMTDPKTGMKMVAYDQLIAPLIQATKELDAKVQALDEDNRALRQEMQNMKETR